LGKTRLDLKLVELGLSESRQKAQALIMSGEVLVNDLPVDKAGAQVPEEAAIRLRTQPKIFVSRGGDKLKAALDQFQVPVQGKVGLDLGSSTGGFTDCLLQAVASSVYALDVGTAQLHEKLKNVVSSFYFILIQGKAR